MAQSPKKSQGRRSLAHSSTGHTHSLCSLCFLDSPTWRSRGIDKERETDKVASNNSGGRSSNGLIWLMFENSTHKRRRQENSNGLTRTSHQYSLLTLCEEGSGPPGRGTDGRKKKEIVLATPPIPDPIPLTHSLSSQSRNKRHRRGPIQ